MSIVKGDPPRLDGPFSKSFKDFIAACLQKDPNEVRSFLIFLCSLINTPVHTKQRPPAKELLNHPFLKKAKPTSSLVELIERRKRWLLKNPHALPPEIKSEFASLRDTLCVYSLNTHTSLGLSQ